MIKIVDIFTKQKYPELFIDCEGVKTDDSSTLIDWLLETKKNHRSIEVYDITNNKKYKKKEKISIIDHINLTGKNPIIGNQEKLGIDFLPLNDLYSGTGNEIALCAEHQFYFSKKYKNKCKHIALLAIASKAVGYNKIKGYLYNI